MSYPEIFNSVVKPYLDHTSIGMCRNHSSKIYSNLKSQDRVNLDEVEYIQGYFNGEAGLAEHFYVKVTYDGETYILDPTVDQFTEENYYDHKSETYIPSSEIPENGIVSEDMVIFDRYQ